jgi:F0F1-type ATP synthase assembly protein I
MPDNRNVQTYDYSYAFIGDVIIGLMIGCLLAGPFLYTMYVLTGVG